MVIKAEYDKLEDVPEVHRELFSERGGKYVVTGIDGLFGPDVKKKLESEAASWRIKHKEASTGYETWRGLKNHEGNAFEKPEDVQALLDQFPTLKSAAEAGGSKSAEAVKAQVEAQAKQLETRYAKQLQERDTKYTAAEQRIQRLENGQRRTFVEQFVQKAIADSKIGKIKQSAIEDVLMYAERHLATVEERDEEGNLVFKDVRTKSNAGVTEDVDVASWLSEMQARKSHWYEESEGGGSGPKGRGGAGGGVNPWSKSGWDVTAQGAYYKQHGGERAAARAKEAGSFLGAPTPPLK
jgi:hypothetical protein